ncbi:alpha-glucosidase [Pedobacter sp. SYP-B3415]|uniref:glycoside hydrolase family 13 protein n=1 Tax=Pedobacter sp. SYP-B3415 TaxID=2496641 RepID=UPI00101BCF81|nr:alpha-glucosidase [Pedobacter sp. SYP-B3415]
MTATDIRKTPQPWWKEAIIYQIYPRSFKDSNGDGIGDLRGIIEKLDYIQRLGVDAVWLNPIFTSPNDDNGYDISDYRNIMDDFGTMDDFDELLSQMHDRGLRLILDLVANHSSDEHPWFIESRKSRDNPYRDYYHWFPAEKGVPPKRFSFFDVKNDAWKYDAHTNSYYLRYFSEKQPDLNWENSALRHEMYNIMRFWLDKGIDGFRMDVIPFISKDTNWPPVQVYSEGPSLHAHLQEMHREVLQHYNMVSIAEGVGVTPEKALNFVDPERKELDLLYHFEGMDIGYIPGAYKVPDPEGVDLLKFKQVYTAWDKVFEQRGWGTIYLGNHDQPRMLSRWGNDDPAFAKASAKLLMTFLLSHRATPFFYAGDELGMSNIRFDSINDYRDIETINQYERIRQEVGDLKTFMDNQKLTARDNGRTPFQWNSDPNAGFSTSNPWLKVNPNYKTVNAELQENDPDSPLSFFRKLVALRRENKTLIYGIYELVDATHPEVYAYSRTLENDRLIVLLNFSSNRTSISLPSYVNEYSVLINNLKQHMRRDSGNVHLEAWQAVIIRVED